MCYFIVQSTLSFGEHFRPCAHSSIQKSFNTQRQCTDLQQVGVGRCIMMLMNLSETDAQISTGLYLARSDVLYQPCACNNGSNAGAAGQESMKGNRHGSACVVRVSLAPSTIRTVPGAIADLFYAPTLCRVTTKRNPR
jgi:hypothetical protein